jgi:hypothetical protein
MFKHVKHGCSQYVVNWTVAHMQLCIGNCGNITVFDCYSNR